MHHSDLLSSVLQRVFERKSDDPLARVACINPCRDRDCFWILADRNIVFVGNIEAAQIFPHENEVDLVITSGDYGTHGSDIGKKLKLFAKSNVGRTEPLADRGRQRTFEGKLV